MLTVSIGRSPIEYGLKLFVKLYSFLNIPRLVDIAFSIFLQSMNLHQSKSLYKD